MAEEADGAHVVRHEATGLQRIEAARARQVFTSGFDAEHDDRHRGGELLRAALFYATVSALREGVRPKGYRLVLVRDEDAPDVRALARVVAPVEFWPTGWPLPRAEKTADDITCLIEAGALIAAEIDRRNRARAKAAKASGR